MRSRNDLERRRPQVTNAMGSVSSNVEDGIDTGDQIKKAPRTISQVAHDARPLPPVVRDDTLCVFVYPLRLKNYGVAHECVERV